MTSHPLDGARSLAQRAAELIEETRRTLAEYAESYMAPLRVVDDQHGAKRLVLEEPLPQPGPIPAAVPVLLKETIDDLRSALDYLVYELACFNTNTDVQDTQFVIVKKPKDFQRLAPRRLAGLKPHQLDAIENVQPYRGVLWTRTLHGLSNPQKHKRLTATAQKSHAAIDARTEATATGHQLHIDAEVSVSVSLPNGDPLLHTVETLQREVGAFIELFDREF